MSLITRLAVASRPATILRRLCVVLVVVFCASAVGMTPALAQSLDDAAAALAADSFDETQKAIDLLVTSGGEQAEPILQALAAGKLFVRTGDNALFIEKNRDGFIDARTGADATLDKAAVKAVRLNNRLRRSVQAAVGAVTLQAATPARRIAAARAVQRSRDVAALPAIDAALAKETDDEARAALETARAAIVVGQSDAPEADRVAAAATIAASGSSDAAAILRSVSADAPQALRDAAETGIASIERWLAFWNAMQNVTYGVSLGSVLLLAAVGLAITFGVMGVINMAHGEMVMIGAYTTYVVQDVIRAFVPELFGASLFIAIPMAFLVSGAIGVAIERGVIRFLYGRPLETLLATWGISLMLQQTVRSIFGPTNREVGTPEWMSGALQLGGLSLTYNRIAIVIFAILVFAALLLVLKKTTLGLQVRAVTQNRRMASAMGIRTDFVDAMTFGLGSGVAGMAGVALSQIDNVSPNLGQGYIIDSFMVVVFGGVGNLWGTLVGALSLGIANKFLEPYAGAVLGKIILLVAIILFIQKRPRGLFALKGRAVEA